VNKHNQFGSDFLWGASTASHQVEGHAHNQWTVWEAVNSVELAKSSQSKIGWVPVWTKIEHQAKDPENYVSGAGVDHYHRYEEDFDIAKSLNLNAFRFGIEWSRIEPEQGYFDQGAIKHYQKYIDRLKSRKITPVINLWHWTVPVWFDELGGFEKKENIRYFENFINEIFDPIINKCNWVLVLNEPNIYSYFSYQSGEWPPGVKSNYKFFKVYLNLLKTHKRVYKLLKQKNPRLMVSSCPQLVSNTPKNPKKISHRAGAKLADYFNNWFWQDRVKKYQDYIGFNNYFINYFNGIGLNSVDNPKQPLNDMGWYMEPSAVGKIIDKISKRYPGVPIMVTENGVADSHDKYRQWWLEETMQALAESKANGANVIGYMHWSLLDNFEWAYGWWPKFGLVEVDRQNNMRRRIRPSAKWWAIEIKKVQR
jgi:beta-glucosidase